MAENVLYCGDNLDVLRRHIKNDSVDLIYLDPPFKSDQRYTTKGRSRPGQPNAATWEANDTGTPKESSGGQLPTAFEDVWRWNDSAGAALEEMVSGRSELSGAMQGFRLLLGESDMLAYLAMMAPRLVELHRTLKDSGSLYLHCDSRASHYLKVLTDSVFGPANFRNEIVWSYGGRGAKAVARQFPRNHDVILFYSKLKGSHYYLRQTATRLFSRKEARQRGFREDEQGRWYKTAPRGDYTEASVRKLEEEGRIHRTSKGSVRVKYFLRQEGGRVAEDVQVSDTWTTIGDAMHMGAERIGYPTQKPKSLLERIILASSAEEDVVLDPFCGSGTTLVVAELLNRRWIGIDNSPIAIGLSRNRLAQEGANSHQLVE